MHALLLADRSNEQEILSFVLQHAGLDVAGSSGLDEAVRDLTKQSVDLIFAALHDQDSQQTLRCLRTATTAPLIMILDPISEDMHCGLLEEGANMVVMRPFSANLLVFQARALLRWANASSSASLSPIRHNGLLLDPTTRAVQVKGQPPKRLTPLEFQLLYTLMSHQHQVIPTELLIEHIWGCAGEGEEALVRGLISRLRAKVEPNPQQPQFILTVPRMGYVFDKPTERLCLS